MTALLSTCIGLKQQKKQISAFSLFSEEGGEYSSLAETLVDD